VRLFVAVRPPPDVVDALAALPRPDGTPTRWTTRDQWHVTLRFFGNVDDPAPIVPALARTVERCAPLDVRIGPRAGLLGHEVVYLPVTGLADIAAAVVEATKSVGDPPPTRRFRAHLTLGRTKGGGGVDTAALALESSWRVTEIELIRSHLGTGPARYETLDCFALGRSAPR
jgi:2'-5' RNA ligase